MPGVSVLDVMARNKTSEWARIAEVSSFHMPAVAGRATRNIISTTNTRLEKPSIPSNPTQSPNSRPVTRRDKNRTHQKIASPRKRGPKAMATSGFSRQPFTAGLGRGAPQQQPQNPLNTYAPAAYAGPSGGAYNSGVVGGPGAAAEARARQERERAAERERQERERREADERAGALEALSEEQREEINEAVSEKKSRVEDKS